MASKGRLLFIFIFGQQSSARTAHHRPSRPQRLICSRRRSYIPATVPTSPHHTPTQKPPFLRRCLLYPERQPRHMQLQGTSCTLPNTHLHKNRHFHVGVSCTQSSTLTTDHCSALPVHFPPHTYTKTAILT